MQHLYNSECEGIIIDVKTKGLDRPTLMSVEYYVDGQRYEIQERVKYKRAAIKIGFIPIGQKRTPKLGSFYKGKVVTILYTSEDPQKAKLKFNEGVDNI